jgi:hypothetical protein
LAAGAGSPSILYNHVNRSFLWGRGLFDPGVLVARPFFLSSSDFRLGLTTLLLDQLCHLLQERVIVL